MAFDTRFIKGSEQLKTPFITYTTEQGDKFTFTHSNFRFAQYSAEDGSILITYSTREVKIEGIGLLDIYPALCEKFEISGLEALPLPSRAEGQSASLWITSIRANEL